MSPRELAHVLEEAREMPIGGHEHARAEADGVEHGRSMGFYCFGVRDDGTGRDGVAARLEVLRGFVQRVLAEDAPVLDTIRFRPRLLVASDRHLARFFKYVREFPRAGLPEA